MGHDLVDRSQVRRLSADAEQVGGVKKTERDTGRRPGPMTEIAARLKSLERKNWGSRQVNEILRKASAYFAQAELDRRFKR
ncbi:MAG: hypothetical protein H7345_05180 [Rubritepida sp.]|nr:hypothetical protein [Rubritepida sp.]